VPTTAKAHKRKVARLIQAICSAFQVSSNRITENISLFPRFGVKANGLKWWSIGIGVSGSGGVSEVGAREAVSLHQLAGEGWTLMLVLAGMGPV
jgi:hypothetical protein